MIRMFLTATFLTEIDATRLAKLNEKLVFFVTKRYENPQNIWVMWNSWELWTSDGTPEGTSMVKPVYTGWNQPMISPATFSHGYLFFQANGVEDKADAQSWKNGVGMWRTDNTTTGTVRIETLNEEMLDVNGTLFFTLHRGICALCRSDGSDPGTTLIWQINEVARSLTGREQKHLLSASARIRRLHAMGQQWNPERHRPSCAFRSNQAALAFVISYGDRLAILLWNEEQAMAHCGLVMVRTPGTVLVRNAWRLHQNFSHPACCW
jgi:hypothetical protein